MTWAGKESSEVGLMIFRTLLEEVVAVNPLTLMSGLVFCSTCIFTIERP